MTDDYQISNTSSGILHRYGQHFPGNSEDLPFAGKQDFFISFSFLLSFSPSFPGPVKLVPCKLIVILLLASRAGASEKGGGRAHHGVQTALAPQGWWVTPSCDGVFRDPLLP